MILHVLLLWIFQSCLSTKFNKTDCPKPKVGHCSCKWTGTEYYHVTCTGLDKVPDSLPPQTTYLKMTDGAIKKIPDNYFIQTQHLIEINLKNNQISDSFYIPRTAFTVNLINNSLKSSMLNGMFHNLTNLNMLDLSLNPLNECLIPKTFKDLEKLNTLFIIGCGIEDLQVGTFVGLRNLQKLVMSSNEITVLRKGILDGIGHERKPTLIEVDFGYNNISHIEDGTFKGQQITALVLNGNKLSSIPNLTGFPRYIRDLKLSDNHITNISSLSTFGIRHIVQLRLDRNNISEIPQSAFSNINILSEVDLSFNSIQQIQPGLFKDCTDMKELFLLNNRLRSLDEESFAGLTNLRGLYLLNNELRYLPDSLFANMELNNIILSRNDFTNLTGRPFKGMNKSVMEIHFFSNPVNNIQDGFFDDLKGTATITLDCENLNGLPHVNDSSHFICTKYFSDHWIKQLSKEASIALSSSGFLCKRYNPYSYWCIPCRLGTFGSNGKCLNCSAGGFYQDELAQVKCKECNIGTFVHPNNAPATRSLTCQACPQGTQSSEKSGYRACKCLPNFYRFDRFGRCFPCPSKAFNCSNDFASLSKGYYWEWKNESMKSDYSDYLKNLMVESRDYTSGKWIFMGSLPVPHKCPKKSCCGGLNSSCIAGYHGPLCSLCDVGYYNRMNSCYRCPTTLWSSLKIVIVIVLFVIVLLAIMWGDKKWADQEQRRTIADKIMSCFKIVIGFYQVMSGVYSASSNIEWPPSVIWMQKILQFVQLNVLEIAPLSCISSKLSFNVLEQFVIVVGMNVGVVGLFLVYMLIRIVFLRQRLTQGSSPRYIEEAVFQTKRSCIRNICVFLFASYPRTCTSIIQVLPVNCLSLCFDSQQHHCNSYLRSDFSVLCSQASTYSNYWRAALFFVFYTVGFPLVVMILVWKYSPEKRNEDNQVHCGQTESPFKEGLSLFSENYKAECWYWEGLEMIRKLILISGLTLIGAHSRTQVGVGAILSALFSILYVYKRPIKNNFENLLQTISLMAIFLNLGVGTMLKSSNESNIIINKQNDQVGVSILLIIINAIVIGLVIAAILKVIITKLIQCCTDRNASCYSRITACFRCCLSLLLVEKTNRSSFTRDCHERDALINRSRDI